MTVNINGGTVNVISKEGKGGFLGGMHSVVNVTGGTVTLDKNSVLGMTEEQQTALKNYYTSNNMRLENFCKINISKGTVEGEAGESDTNGGSISAPYGNVMISGAETAVKVYNCMAYCGEISISDASGKKYTNPYTGDDRLPGHGNLSICIANRLSAKNLTIDKSSVVYAAKAYANVVDGETGHIIVTHDKDNTAYLYTTGAYGIIGQGDGTYDYVDGKDGNIEDRNVFGVKVVDVHYEIKTDDVLLSKDVDRVTNPNLDSDSGLPYYIVMPDTATDTKYTLKPALCSGYNFLGWYQYNPETKQLTDEKIEMIDKSNSKDVYIGAKWEKVNVEFEIHITLENSDDADTTNMEQVDGDSNKWRFTKTVEVPYGSPILSKDGIDLTDTSFMTKTKSIVELNYEGKKVLTDATVMPEMSDAYVKDGNPLVLEVSRNGTQLKNVLVTLNQNKNEKNRPEDTRFNLNTAPGVTINSGGDTFDTVSCYQSISIKLNQTKAFSKDDSLITPTAPGYTFGGWYFDKECTKPVTENETLQELSKEYANIILYAKWTPNKYLVKFSTKTEESDPDTDNRWVTPKDEPGANDPAVLEKNYVWTYDTPPTELVNPDKETDKLTSLPKAWREGYVFKCWQYKDNKGAPHRVTDYTELRKTIEALDISQIHDTSNKTAALTLYAEYRPVKVTYEPNGGSWVKGTSPSPNDLIYGNALAGYTKLAAANNSSEYDKLGTVSSADGKTQYSVVSTTSGYFSTNKKYVDNDYRKVISRKGYTFQGWKKDGEAESNKYYGCVPRFNDLVLIADWKANTYDLELHVKYDSYDEYISKFSNPDDNPKTISNVKVGEKIPVNSLPEKEKWYAYNPDADTNTEKHRLLLGMTFAALDPGNSDDTNAGSVYNKYAKAVTNMLNSKTMFDNGDVFTIPDDDSYKKDLDEAVVANTGFDSIPDYPTGSTIPMYGVYRERSLVFIEQYVDSEGKTNSKIMYTHPWNQYTDYPYNAYRNDESGKFDTLTSPTGGYALVGWYALSGDIDASRRYPENNNDNKFEDTVNEWRKLPGADGIYDINVYTAYVPSLNIEQELTANSSPTVVSYPSTAYTLPGSMQQGVMSYKITNKDGKEFHIIDKTSMLAHQYDSTWKSDDGNITYSADNTFAIELTLSKDGSSNLDPVSLVVNQNAVNVASQAIGKDWKLTLTLYHSKVMTAKNTYNFDISYSFAGLSQQRLTADVTVNLCPSQYEVTYSAVLPEDISKLNVINDNDFNADTDKKAYEKTVTMDYGATLLLVDETLVLEGYTRNTYWSYGDTELADGVLSLEKVTFAEPDSKKAALENGKLTLTAEYTPNEYTLEKDESLKKLTLGSWTITYSDGASDANSNNDTLLFDSASVKYHSSVTFKPSQYQKPEFITLTYSKNGNEITELLSEYRGKTEVDGKYIISMPASDVTVGYSEVITLYLDEGTIELFPDGFKQKNKYGDILIQWSGDYRILQNKDNDSSKPTLNVLKLYGDLTKRPSTSGGSDIDRKIALGNLNISSDDSIALVTDGSTSSSANLTQKGNIVAKNILVPSKTSLRLTGTEGNKITLTPECSSANTRAAIGAANSNPENGNITLSNVNVVMSLEAPSSSSGIGSGSQSAPGCGAVTISGGSITVKEKNSVSGQYTGAWIGGAGVTDVSVTNTTISGSGENHKAKAVDGGTVKLENCTIGSESAPVMEPIHANSSLTITDCYIYQQNEHSISGAMIGTDSSGTTTINNSTVHVRYTGVGSSASLYTGKLIINDAASDVTIWGNQIIEVSNGDITIGADIFDQSSEHHTTSSSKYLLLSEKVPAVSSDLTVNVSGKTITVKAPADTSQNATTIGAMNISGNTDLVLDGDLIVSGVASVAADNTLTVTGNEHGITYRAGLTGEGDYVQNNGRLTGNDNVVVKGNMTLKNVTADCTVHSIGSNGGGDKTATTVTISGGNVTAKNIGAIGEQNKTFTFVKTDSEAKINGKLIRDHYRLQYLTSGIDVVLKGTDGKALPTVLRTETETASGIITVLDSKPAKPTGTDEQAFNCWYILSKNGSKRLALLDSSETTPGGLNSTALLDANTDSKGMSEPAEDGTSTLNVYAWLNAKGTAAIKAGRLFDSFDDGTDTADISNRYAWTVKITSNATYSSDRDYQVEFSENLPAGTDLTLTVIKDGGLKEFYYYTLSAEKQTINFSDFTKMGTANGSAPTFVYNENGGDETFLLSADFRELPDGSDPVNNTVSFSAISNGTAISLGDGAEVSYSISTIVKGVISCEADNKIKVVKLPSGDENRSGKALYLVATLSKTAESNLKLPLNAEGALNNGNIKGELFSGNTMAFNLGKYSDAVAAEYSYTFSGLPDGTYLISWKLCTGNDGNMLGGACSDEATSSLTVSTVKPWLKVTYDSESRVLAKGSYHTLQFGYSTNANEITVTVEKQGLLGAFSNSTVADQTVTISAGNNPESIDVIIPAEAGTYRVRFSINKDSGDDDVFYTFIVE